MPANNKQNKYGENNQDLPKELQDVLKDIVEDYEKEDKFIYQQQLKTCRKNEEYFHGIQYLFWSDVAKDWRVPSEADLSELEGSAEPLYDYVINIYRAHGESVIAALSQQIPPIYFPPDDADNPDDLFTSKTFSKISELIDRHNRIKLLLVKALFILWNQGLICAYNYSKSSSKFGKVSVPKFESQEFKLCPNCMNEVGEDNVCPTCGPVNPSVQQAPVQVGSDDLPKSRELLDVYGPLNVKVPYYARTQADVGYLILNIEQHYALLRNLYPHIADKIQAGDSSDKYDRWARRPTNYSSASKSSDDAHLLTVRRCWLRAWSFDRLEETEKDKRDELRELFPNGAYVVFVGDHYAESRDESMDDHWTLSEAGVSENIHSDALGQSLMSLQDMRNTLANLGIETLEHGIPETFADPEVLNFDEYGKQENTPGYINQIKQRIPGEAVGESFFTLPKSSLSKDYFPLKQELDKDAQFVVGSFPSIYGGPGEGNSRTFGEYQMSRAMALQRLTIAWGIIVDVWARMKDKAVRAYAKNMLDDEKFVKKQNGSYLNVWIRRAEMSGKVGDVEPEPSEAFPVSSDRKRDVLMKLMELNNDYINAAIYHPENTKNIAESLAYPDFYIPGSDQRNKQYKEIQIMQQAGPLAPPEMDPNGNGISSVPIDIDVDDHAVHIQVCKDYLVSDAGWDLMQTNPQAFENIKIHLKEHQQALMMQTMGMHEGTAPGQSPDTAAAQTTE